MPNLVDQYGRPIDLAALRAERAAPSVHGLRQLWHAPVATGLTPERLGSILLQAVQGDATAYLTLAEEMEERDLHYSSVLTTRRLAVSGLNLSVAAASDSAHDVRLADEVRAFYARPEMGDLVFDLLDAIGKGYSVIEAIWDTSARDWAPKELVHRDPRHFLWDRETGRELRLLDASDPVRGVALEPYKFLVHRPRIRTGLPIRGGLARLCAVAYMCKAYGLKDWLAFAEIFGLPLRLGKYHPSATQKDIDTLIRAVANIGTDAAAVIPETMGIEFIKGGDGGAGPALFSGLADYWDKQMSKATLGQTMTTDGQSGGLAQAKVHEGVLEIYVRHDAAQAARTLDRDLVRPLIDLNHGPQAAYPRTSISIDASEDLKLLAEALGPFIDRGLGVEASVIRDKFGLPEPAPGAVLLSPSSSFAPSPFGAPGLPESPPALAREEPRKTPTVDPLTTFRDMALEEWEPLIGPVLDPVFELAKEAVGLEEFEAKLGALLSRSDSSKLVQVLATALLKARAQGEVDA